MTHIQRPYLFYDVAISICSTCYRKVEGKIVFEDDRVFLRKRCPEHGPEKVLLADDVEYYKRSREVFLKPPEQPLRYNTPIKYGCPYDCGLCPDHEQHSCLTVLEITDACNLECPICYAESGPSRQSYRSLATVERMLDAVVRNEGEPDVVQISGGEPTLHPQFFEILDAARERPIRHLMVNTNGIRLARDRAFAERLAGYEDIEVYLQFDSFEREALMSLRGADLRETRTRAVDVCNELNLSVNLVCTIQKGQNDHELGRIIEYALDQRAVRGVTFQPIQAAGRLGGYDPVRDRLTLTEVRRRILEQSEVFRPEDILPVPCHPDSLAMAYALKLQGEVIPLTGMMPVDALLEGARNTISFEGQDDIKDSLGEALQARVGEHVREGVKERLFDLLSTRHSPRTGASSLKELLCCLPKLATPRQWTYENLFRVIILEFIDAYGFDVRSVKKSCVHIVHPDGRLIPFDTYNLFYRDELEETVLRPLREGRAPAESFSAS